MCSSLAGNGRLGAFQRTRLFLLVSYGSCEQKRGRVRELRVTLCGFLIFFLLRVKLVSKCVFIGI